VGHPALSAVDLLGLVMIVKNEARGIAATLASARPFVDRWTVLDTGSTDGTPGLIRAALADVPGEVRDGAFVDFATTRNAALDLLAGHAAWALMLSGDDHVEGEPAALRAWLAARPPHAGAAYATIVDGGTSYQQPRLSRPDAPWRYAGVTHEALVGPLDAPPPPRAPLRIRRTPPPDAERRARWELDLALLAAAHAAAPRDARTTFYLAQTYGCLGRVDEAVAHYDARVALGGWREEAFIAALRAADHVAARGPAAWPEAQQRYLAAHALAPHRAEPLVRLAEHWIAAGSYGPGFLFAARAAALPYPPDLLFVEDALYAWRAHDLAAEAAWYVGEFAAGEAHARAAARAGPADPRLTRAVRFYAHRRGEGPPP